MKERPILFSAPMVRAILDGSKTQTRRVVKPQPQVEGDSIYWSSPRYDNGMGCNYFHTRLEPGLRLMLKACPYGQPGDQLWVRETWGYIDPDGTGESHINDHGGQGPVTFAAELRPRLLGGQPMGLGDRVSEN